MSETRMERLKAELLRLVSNGDPAGYELKNRLLEKYRWEPQIRVHELMTDDEVDQILAHAKKVAPKTDVPADAALRRDLAVLIYDTFRILW